MECEELKNIYGLERLTSLKEISIYGNERLLNAKGLNVAIGYGKNDVTRICLDAHLFPDAIGFDVKTKKHDEKIIEAMSQRNSIFKDSAHYGYEIKEMLELHKKALKINKANVPPNSTIKEKVYAVERYLSENVVHSAELASEEDFEKGTYMTIDDHSAYKCIMKNQVVCDGFSEGMRYLLKVEGIQSHMAHCATRKYLYKQSTEDCDRIAAKKVYQLTKDDEATLNKIGTSHGILCIDDYHDLYCDPCWSAGSFKLPIHCLRTTEEMWDTGHLLFEKDRVNNEIHKMPDEERQAIYDKISDFKNDLYQKEGRARWKKAVKKSVEHMKIISGDKEFDIWL